MNESPTQQKASQNTLYCFRLTEQPNTKPKNSAQNTKYGKREAGESFACFASPLNANKGERTRAGSMRTKIIKKGIKEKGAIRINKERKKEVKMIVMKDG